ncbi:MAG: hypothetical protein AAF560_04380 [Acidobacteriota bacterium]
MTHAKIDELDRILTSEEELQPMTGFSVRVMRAVREEAATPAPIPFPWERFLPGVLLNAGLLLGAAVWLLLASWGSASSQTIPTEWFSNPQARGLLWATLTVAGTGLLAWTATRWASPRRESWF